MIRDEFKHTKKMKKLVKEMEELELALGTIENEYRTKEEAFTGIKARREEMEKLQNVLGGSEAIESFKRIDKEFDSIEGDLNKNLDKFHNLSVKLALKAAKYEKLMFDSIDILIQDQIKLAEEKGKELLELRAKQVKLEREREEIQALGRDLVSEYNEKSGKRFAYEMELMDLRLLGFKPNTIYGAIRVV